MQMFGKCVGLGLCLTVSVAYAKNNDRLELGKLQTNATVSFVRATEGEWGIEIVVALLHI